MGVKVVTDSLSDITEDVAKRFGITVVPAYVRFGNEVFRDRIDITTDEFYLRLSRDDVFPSTTQPSPADFLAAFENLSSQTDEILTVCLSSKLSGTYQSALTAKTMYTGSAQIEVIDSGLVIMSLGLVVIYAAKLANRGAGLAEIKDEVMRLLGHSRPVMLMNTLKYLEKGGRIGKAKAFLGSLLSLKYILTLKDGEVFPLTRVRSRHAGIEYLYNFAMSFKKVDSIAVEYATDEGDADYLVERLLTVYPAESIYKSTISPVIGAYVGPGALSVSVLEVP